MSVPTRSRTWSTNAQPAPRARKNTLPSSSAAALTPSFPPSYTSTTTTTATTATTLEETTSAHAHTHLAAAAITSKDVSSSSSSSRPSFFSPPPDDDNAPDGEPVATPSFLQPRVAAVLGVSRRWHPVLFSLRLLSILPAIVLGFPLAIRFLLMLHAFTTTTSGGQAGDQKGGGGGVGEERLLLTELMLAIIWCGCSGYLSFFFTDYLMSRWLINYTPSATAFRLVSISALNGYLQSWTLHLSGSSQDPFLLLPTWIIITSTLTLVYHITYRKINIRKETSTSISVFSMASYISMVALLIQQHWDRTDWLELPFVALGCRVVRGGGEVVVWVAKYANITVAP